MDVCGLPHTNASQQKVVVVEDIGGVRVSRCFMLGDASGKQVTISSSVLLRIAIAFFKIVLPIRYISVRMSVFVCSCLFVMAILLDLGNYGVVRDSRYSTFFVVLCFVVLATVLC